MIFKNQLALSASAVAMAFVVILSLSAAADERAGGAGGREDAGTGSAAQQTGSIVGWGSQVVVPQDELADLVSVAGGREHSLGLKADGSIVAWGRNDFGQTDVPSPNSDFVAVAGGNEHSLGLKAGGPPCAAAADLNCDGVVNGLDLLILLEAWGDCDDPDDCPADLNGDDVVNVLDLLILLENWG